MYTSAAAAAAATHACTLAQRAPQSQFQIQNKYSCISCEWGEILVAQRQHHCRIIFIWEPEVYVRVCVCSKKLSWMDLSRPLYYIIYFMFLFGVRTKSADAVQFIIFTNDRTCFLICYSINQFKLHTLHARSKWCPMMNELDIATKIGSLLWFVCVCSQNIYCR